MLSREDILRADDLKRERVEVPEWGGYVYIRCLRGAERDYIQSEMQKSEDSPGVISANTYRDNLVLLSLCDEDNHPIFGLEEREVLHTKSAQVIEKLFLIALRLNRLRNEDVEITVKNYNGITAGVSGSDLL